MDEKKLSQVMEDYTGVPTPVEFSKEYEKEVENFLNELQTKDLSPEKLREMTTGRNIPL